MAYNNQLRRRHVAFRGVLALLAGIVLAPSATVQAQATSATPPSSDNEILVTGLRDRLKTVDRFVRGLTVVNSNDPLARYEPGKYCPAVLGLSERVNGQVAARMRAVAAAASVVPAGLKCTPSAMVIFVEDKAKFLAAFRKQHPVYFTDFQDKEDLPPPEKGPATAWHLVQLLDPQGNPVQRDPAGFGVVESSSGGSRLRSMVQPVVVMAVVVMERKALLGLNAMQIADYALMRTLTDRAPDFANVPGQVTILKALTAPMGTPVPASLTKWDLAYLKGRYSGDPRRYGQGQSAGIRSTVRRATETEPDQD